MSYWWLFAFCAGSYLIGTINFSVIISKYVLKSDVRQKGSGNPGASNMLRNYGKKWGLVIMLTDALIKGAIPALVGVLVYGNGYNPHPLQAVSNSAGQIALFACGLASVLGHCFPVWSKFRGGKGMGSLVGVFIVANPALGLCGWIIWMLLIKVMGNAAVPTFILLTTMVLWEMFLKSPNLVVMIILTVIYFLIIFTHRSNLYRILRGAEHRIVKVKKKTN